jgi:ethanolamine utilization microcompartment shell protein EutS
MLLRSYFILPLLVLTLTFVGCAGPKASKTPSASSMADPIRVKSADLAVGLIRIAEQGSEGTLIDDPGWREYVIEIENLSANDLTVQNVKLLNQNGRYVDSASAYAQITAPPDVAAELAGDVAEKAAGMAAGQVIPFGGTIISVLSNTASAWSAGAKENAKQAFMMRVLKNVELTPTGKVEGSAFLPNITRPKTLIVDYVQDGITNRIEIPLPIQEP